LCFRISSTSGSVLIVARVLWDAADVIEDMAESNAGVVGADMLWTK
jgi:hypothetical protein